MNTISAQEIKNRGMAAVDDALAQGPVHVIKNNRPRYVVLTEEGYRELIEAAQEGALARIKSSREDAAAGQVTRHESVEALMRHIEAE